MVLCKLHINVSDCDCDCPEFRDGILFKEGRMYDPRKFQFLEKWQNRNFD